MTNQYPFEDPYKYKMGALAIGLFAWPFVATILIACFGLIFRWDFPTNTVKSKTK